MTSLPCIADADIVDASSSAGQRSIAEEDLCG